MGIKTAFLAHPEMSGIQKNNHHFKINSYENPL